LAVEAAFSTEWLLWPAVASGVVAVITAIGVPLGFWGEVALFAGLTVAATLLSRRLIQRVNPSDSPDINAREGRLIGQRAQVVQAFVDGRGRVFVSGAEWPAEIEGVAPLAGESVIVEGVDGPKLKVRAA
ncbi:MAG TPA: NfeD family protein, partial [Brevundimonas sp.]|nr:NfeD family protein [Brevundimonas sp.]